MFCRLISVRYLKIFKAQGNKMDSEFSKMHPIYVDL
jgi:hypothetical protein